MFVLDWPLASQRLLPPRISRSDPSTPCRFRETATALRMTAYFLGWVVQVTRRFESCHSINHQASRYFS